MGARRNHFGGRKTNKGRRGTVRDKMTVAKALATATESADINRLEEELSEIEEAEEKTEGGISCRETSITAARKSLLN